jgi:hypothetical protein
VNASATEQPHEQGWYEIRLEGRLDPRWSAWLDGLDITSAPDGTTVIHGRVVDQAALHGLLSRLRDIGLPLMSVARVDPDQAPDATHPDTSIGD